MSFTAAVTVLACLFLVGTLVLFLIEGHYLRQKSRLLAEAKKHNDECLALRDEGRRLLSGAAPEKTH